MEQSSVQGSIFFLLKRFVAYSLPEGSWEKLLKNAKLDNSAFELTGAYPLESMAAIISAASEMTGLSSEELKEKFGEYMVPDLFQMYKHFLQPDWKTYEVLMMTEKVFHGAVRRLNSAANPPILSVSEVSQELLMIDYYSKRKMGSLALGIIKGIAKFYGEQDYVSVQSLTAPDSERVQIKVQFAKKTAAAQ